MVPLLMRDFGGDRRLKKVPVERDLVVSRRVPLDRCGTRQAVRDLSARSGT